MAEFDLTVEQSIILMMLYNSPNPLTSKEIENFTLRQPSSISKLIRRMVDKGLILRRKEGKSRGYSVSITDTGQTLCSKLTNVSIEMVLSILKDDERQRFADHLTTLNTRARYLLGTDKSLPDIG